MDWENSHRAFIKQREVLDETIRTLEKWMANELLWKIIIALESQKPDDFSYLSLVQEVGAEKLVETLLTFSDAWGRETSIVKQGDALFLICSLARDEVVQSFFRWFYRNNNYVPVSFEKSLVSLEREFLLMKKSRPHLPRYMEVLRKNIAFLGHERVLFSINSSKELSGYIFAEVYRQGFPLERIYTKIYSPNNGNPLFIIMDIIKKSPTSLTDAQFQELAVYALRNFNLYSDYDELEDQAFHETLILNANVTGLHPANTGIRAYLEKIAPLEDQV